MRIHWNRNTRIMPFTTHTNSDQACKVSCVPQFENAEQFIQAKLKMLVQDFRIHPTETEIEHLYELKTESEINRAVRQIINDHWR